MNLTINADQLVGESSYINRIQNDIYKLQTTIKANNDYYTKEEIDTLDYNVKNEIHDVKNSICNIKFDVEALKTVIETVKRSTEEVGEAFRALSAKFAESQKKKDDLEFFEAKIEYSDFLGNAPAPVLLSIKSNPFII